MSRTAVSAEGARTGAPRRFVPRAVGAGLVAAAILAGLLLRAPSGPRSLSRFDPDRMADLEVAMWRAYYARERVRLFGLLATMLHEQYAYDWARALRAGFHLARAAAVFGDARGGYQRVLPDLEDAYAIAREWTGAGFDPAAVARAELAWWEARRIPGRSGAAEVGRLIAEEYALLYQAPRASVERAALLRAEAGALRDRGGPAADWPEVSRLLHDSYRSLRAALSARGR